MRAFQEIVDSLCTIITITITIIIIITNTTVITIINITTIIIILLLESNARLGCLLGALRAHVGLFKRP